MTKIDFEFIKQSVMKYWWIIAIALFIKFTQPEMVVQLETAAIIEGATVSLTFGAAMALAGFGLLFFPGTQPIGIAILIGAFLLIGVPLFGLTWVVITNARLLMIIVGLIVGLKILISLKK